uniref:Uncharacterized protein n=1 Tax=Anguilla anguilla TaxID=7936 RepID=A0A0E9TR69_ANGAN
MYCKPTLGSSQWSRSNSRSPSQAVPMFVHL